MLRDQETPAGHGPWKNKSNHHGGWFDPAPENDIVAEALVSGEWQVGLRDCQHFQLPALGKTALAPKPRLEDIVLSRWPGVYMDVQRRGHRKVQEGRR